MSYRKGKENECVKVCINLEELYNNGVQYLKYGGYIACTDDGGLCHFDLYKDDDIYGENVAFLLCDRDSVTVFGCQNNEDFIICESEYGKRIILSKKEFDIAAFKPREPINWFEIITERLSSYSQEPIWSNEDEILVKTEDTAKTIVNLLETLYQSQGEDVVFCTGYYDPKEDTQNNETDKYTGWWYITIG